MVAEWPPEGRPPCAGGIFPPTTMRFREGYFVVKSRGSDFVFHNPAMARAKNNEISNGYRLMPSVAHWSKKFAAKP
jgi:hypothetical protein